MEMQRVTKGRSSEHTNPLSVPVDLDLLSRMSSRELDALYRRARLPRSLDLLNGTPRGRMLALVSPLDQGLLFGAIRAFADSSAFPWHGKSFIARQGDRYGSGINRTILLGDLFRFDTRIEPSAVDGEPCIVLDYDLPRNPWFIRRIHDELREVAEGLFLGPAMWKGAAGKKLVLHFAIDTRSVH
jgi:hypothetical protein